MSACLLARVYYGRRPTVHVRAKRIAPCLHLCKVHARCHDGRSSTHVPKQNNTSCCQLQTAFTRV